MPKAKISLSPVRTDNTVMVISFRIKRVWTNIADPDQTYPKEQSDQGLHCLQFQLHLFDEIPLDLASLFEF